MMNTADDKMIQRYVDEEMTEDEREDFEIKLLHTEMLRDKVEEYRFIANGIQYYGEKEAWKKIQAFEAEAVDEEPKGNPYVTKWLYRGLAASLLLLMIGFPFYWQQDELRYARLFESKFEPYEVLGGATRGESSEEDFVLPQAFEAYFKGNYTEARELFTLASRQEDRAYIWLYLGNAYLAHDENDDADPQKAIEALEKVLTYPDLDLKSQWRTHWYLGLAHLKLNHEEEARRQFELIQDTDQYGEEAKNILKSIY